MKKYSDKLQEITKKARAKTNKYLEPKLKSLKVTGTSLKDGFDAYIVEKNAQKVKLQTEMIEKKAIQAKVRQDTIKTNAQSNEENIKNRKAKAKAKADTKIAAEKERLHFKEVQTEAKVKLAEKKAATKMKLAQSKAARAEIEREYSKNGWYASLIAIFLFVFSAGKLFYLLEMYNSLPLHNITWGAIKYYLIMAWEQHAIFLLILIVSLCQIISRIAIIIYQTFAQLVYILLTIFLAYFFVKVPY